MDDDEVQVVEVTMHTGSPPKKRRRKVSVPRQEIVEIPSSDDMVYKAAQLKRRLAFCEKEQKELSKRFQEIKEQLTEEQFSQLDVKLESSDEHEPLIRVSDSGDEEVVFVLPEDYSPIKRRKLSDAQKAEKFNDQDNQMKNDVAITYFKPGTTLPHAREHCTAHKFVQSNVTTSTVSCNEIHCGQCYCYICDALVKECKSWKTGNNPHCNGYAKNTFWEKLRKMAKRKTSAVQDSLLKCLPENEQTEALREAASKVTELLETLKDEIDKSPHNARSSSPACFCDCHGDEYHSDDSYGFGEGCRWCWEEHESRLCDYNWSSRYGGWGFNLSSYVSNTVSKGTEYLKVDQPAQAAVVLDAVTVLLLAADGERFPFGHVNGALRSLRKAWIEVLMHPDLPKNLENKVRERLKNAVNGAFIRSPESTGLEVVLEMKKWDDESLVKCFAGKSGDDFITEDEEVAEARLAFLEKNKRFSDALFYMLSCKVMQKNAGSLAMFSRSEQRLADISGYRHKFILLLAKTGKVDQALKVVTVPGSAELEKDVLTNTTRPKEAGINVNYSQCALGSMSYGNMTELLIDIARGDSSSVAGNTPSPQTIPEAKLRQVLALILTGLQVNSGLRTETALEWCINTFCESSLSNDLAKDVRQKYINQAEQLLNKAKNRLLSPSDINPPCKGPFKVFVVELFAALAVRVFAINSYYQTHQITNTMRAFKRKDLQWACVSVVSTPTVTNRISAHILGFVLDNVIKPLGSDCIPLAVYESWIKNLPDMYGLEKNYEIAHFIMQEEKGKLEKNQNASKGVVLMKKIIETAKSMLKSGCNWNKGKLTTILKKMRKALPPGLKELKELENEIVGLTFKNDPTYANLEAVRKACKKENWPQLRESLMNFLKTYRCTYITGCIDVFGQCCMFDEVKQTLVACGQNGSVPSICDKIKQTLSKLKRDDACRLADVCADWLGKTLCNAGFINWRYDYRSTPEALLSCLRAIAAVNVQSFNGILSSAMRDVVHIFLNKTVQARHRSDLERWLKDIKSLFSSQNQTTAWSWAFHEMTTGRLKRKTAVVSQLKNSSFLLSGTIPYDRLLQMQVQENAATNSTSSKPAQAATASTQSVNTTSSTPTNGPRTNTPPGPETRHQTVNMAASTLSNASVAKAAQKATTSKQGVNIAQSATTSTPSSRLVQSSAAPKEAINMTVPNPTKTPIANPAANITVNIAGSTKHKTTTATLVRGTTTPQQPVSLTTPTPTNITSAKSTQVIVATGSANKARIRPTNTTTAKTVQVPAATQQVVNAATSTLNRTPVQGNPYTMQPVRVALAPRQTIANPPRGTTQMTAPPLPQTSHNKAMTIPNSVVINQQIAQAIASYSRIPAGNNVLIKIPPGAISNISDAASNCVKSLPNATTAYPSSHKP